MRICLVYHGSEFPPSERIEKVASSLARAGHQIFLLCNNDGRFSKSQETVGDVHVSRLRPSLRSRRLNRAIKLPVFFNPLWALQLRSHVTRLKIEALHVVDIPLAVLALGVGRRYGIPVVLDMWENYPQAVKLWAQTHWTTHILRNYYLARAVEAYVVRRVNHVITVVEEQKQRLVAEGVPEERISVVTNAVDASLFCRTAVRNDTCLDADPTGYKVLYVGGITSERGLDDLIRALPVALAKIPEVRLYIAGKGNDEPRLRRLAAEEGVGEHVRFLGWLPFEDIHSYVLKSDLCAVPHLSTDFINTTMPNKLFQYMLLAKPVLVSSAKPLARIVREAGCGFVFESGNPADAAARIIEAYEKRRVREIGERGRQAVLRSYTWDKVEPELLRIYDQVRA
jgi:glycosyltransferase involved in cell wall biosynthesis